MNKGKIIVFEGLDYSFKETNSKRLYEYIKKNITEKVILISFPNYESNSSYFVKEYLKGNYGDINEVDQYKTSLLYAVDRFDTIKKHNIEYLYDNGYYIIIDRYTGSNIIFQSVKIEQLLKDRDKKEIDNHKYRFIDWVISLEHEILDLPIADITIYMHMPLSKSYELMKQRDLKNKQDKDIHEDNREYLQLVEDNALEICNRLDWKIIQCTDMYNDILSEDQIFNDILCIVKSYCNN